MIILKLSKNPRKKLLKGNTSYSLFLQYSHQIKILVSPMFSLHYVIKYAIILPGDKYMNIIGIVAEYNPFHNGHLYQIKKIKEMYPDSMIIAVISSYFTQRGDISILNKWDKTKIALDNGIDLVVELPFFYATQSSDIFALGAISILSKMNIDTLVFGTEAENIDKIKEIAKLQLTNQKYDQLVKDYIKEGLNYPTATSRALDVLAGYKINTPNDILALSYIKAVQKINPKINIINIKRTTNYHGTEINNNITSASNIRSMLINNEDITQLVPYSTAYLSRITKNNLFPYLKYKVISEDINIKQYQTVDEGIENRILNNIYTSKTIEELISKIKTKRYTYNKISRMFLHIVVGLTKETAKNTNIDYIRILGFTNTGQDYLNKIKKKIDLPIITAYQKNISPKLDLELNSVKIYSLITNTTLIKKEYQKKPIIK